MKTTWMRYAAAATALAAALALAAPAQAAVLEGRLAGPDLVRAAWQWIARLWSAPESAVQPATTGRAGEKEGSGVDPIGGQGQSATPPAGTQRSGDPNG